MWFYHTLYTITCILIVFLFYNALMTVTGVTETFGEK